MRLGEGTSRREGPILTHPYKGAYGRHGIHGSLDIFHILTARK